MRTTLSGAAVARAATLIGIATIVSVAVATVSCSTNEYPSSQALSQGTAGPPPPDVTSLEQLQSSFRYVAEAVLPSVVRIDVSERLDSDSGGQDRLFDFFFGQPDDRPPRPDGFESRGVGSGVVVGSSGGRYFVLTNDHVVGAADTIIVVLNDESEYSGSLVGRDVRKDLALVEFASSAAIPIARLGDSDTLRVGDLVVAVGSPFGFRNTVTTGIVSALGRNGGPDQNISDFIQTDASINQGNSGGALVNLSGEVIGINTWITSDSGGSIGLGFAIPINNVVRSLESLLETGTVEYGWLGVTIEDVGVALVDELRLPDRRGSLISSVYEGSPADDSGLLPGDFVVSIDGNRVRNSDDLILLTGEIPVDDRIAVEVIRQSHVVELTVEVGARPSDQSIEQMNRRRWPGFSVHPITAEIVAHLELAVRRGVIVTDVDPGTLGEFAGVRAFDVIQQVNGVAIRGILAFYEALNNATSSELEMVVVRDGQELSFTLER